MSGGGGVGEDSGSGENTRPVSLWIAHGSRSVTLHYHDLLDKIFENEIFSYVH